MQKQHFQEAMKDLSKALFMAMDHYSIHGRYAPNQMQRVIATKDKALQWSPSSNESISILRLVEDSLKPIKLEL